MRLSLLSALVASTVAAPSQEGRVDSPLAVRIEMLDNSRVKAVIENRGHESLKVLEVGSILSPGPVEKAKVFADDKPVEFGGIQVRVALGALDESHFRRIPAGRSVEAAFDLADTHDLSSGGKFGVRVHGAFSVAEDNGTRLVGSVPYTSNYMVADVDGSRAGRSRWASLEQRGILQRDCSGERLVTVRKALAECASMARRARAAASRGPADRMEEYFQSSSSAVREAVADVFERVASECGSVTGGTAKFHCADVANGCDGKTLAYTAPISGNMVFCPLYFNTLPDLAHACHGQDKATTNIHEATHLKQIKGTDDYGGYGYSFLRSLTPERNLNHADTYALFAGAVRQNC